MPCLTFWSWCVGLFLTSLISVGLPAPPNCLSDGVCIPDCHFVFQVQEFILEWFWFENFCNVFGVTQE